MKHREAIRAALGGARRAAGVLLAGAGLTILALCFNAVPLLVPGIGFLLLGIAAPVWVWCTAVPIQLARRLAADRVVEGEPLEAAVEVRRAVISLPGAELLDSLCQDPVSLTSSLSIIRGGRRAEVRIVARFARRGRRTLPPPSLLVRDPLGLSRVRRTGAGTQEVLVLPRTEPVRWNAAGGRARSHAGGHQAEPTAAVEIDGLRPYRPGTPASRIHWPAVARGAGLLERRLRQDGDMRPLVALDLRRAASEEAVDAAVRAAASLTIDLAREGGCRVLFGGERRPMVVDPDLATWPAVHARLAVVDARHARAPILESSGRMAAVFYVVARAAGTLPPVLTTPGGAAAILVVPADLAPPPTGRLGFEVSGCRGYVLNARARQAA